MRTLVIGDIHGGLKALQQVLERASVTPVDRLVFLGDYVDGWSESPAVLSFLIELRHSHPHCVFLRGNHDQLVLEWLTERNENLDENLWFRHGGEATVNAYRNVADDIRSEHITFLESLQNYFIDDRNRLFVHAGFTNQHGVTHEYFPRLLYWDRTLWELALALDSRLPTSDPKYPARLKLYTAIFIGHTPVTRLGHLRPLRCANVWNVDTGAAFHGPLTLLDADTGSFWQSDPLPSLYPGEKGRNP